MAPDCKLGLHSTVVRIHPPPPNIFNHHSPIAQLVERRTVNAVVARSIRARGAKQFKIENERKLRLKLFAHRRAQLCVCVRGWKSRNHFGGVAHLAERLVCNQDVAGSIPVTSTNFVFA